MNMMQNVKKPIVSVVIPTHNAALFIEEAIKSVLAQSIPEFEIIIIDDASTDNTLKIVQGLADADSRIRYFIQEKAGVSVARNKGISLARGSHIAFLDHDDLWLPEKLEKQLKAFGKDDKIGLVFSRAAIMTDNGKEVGSTGGFGVPLRGYIFRELFDAYFIPLSTVVLKREVFNTLDEWFVESMEMAEEIDLFLRVAYTWKVDYCDEVLGKWRMHPHNDSRLRKWLLINDYNEIIERLEKKIPDFAKNYKQEIERKQRWLAVTKVEILLSERRRKEALKEIISFLEIYGFYPKALVKLFVLFIFGFAIYDKIRQIILNFYVRINIAKRLFTKNFITIRK